MKNNKDKTIFDQETKILLRNFVEQCIMRAKSPKQAYNFYKKILLQNNVKLLHKVFNCSSKADIFYISALRKIHNFDTKETQNLFLACFENYNRQSSYEALRMMNISKYCDIYFRSAMLHCFFYNIDF